MVEDSITITVSGKADVDWIRNKVRNGQFASEAEVVSQGISTLREDEAELELWLKDFESTARYDEHKANPGSAIPNRRGRTPSRRTPQSSFCTEPVSLPVAFNRALGATSMSWNTTSHRFSDRNAAVYTQRIVSACQAIGLAPYRGTQRDDIRAGVR